MRIISGKFKGRKIRPPKNLPVRPTTDFAKEGLFNVLRTRVDLHESEVLDLFCGTGNMSVEFVSRGASTVKSVDLDRNCLSYIQKICGELDIHEIQTIKYDSLKYLKKEENAYDLIFADPPYIYREGEALLELIMERGLLKPNAYFVLEHGKDQSFDTAPYYEFSKKFGNVNFTFFLNSSK